MQRIAGVGVGVSGVCVMGARSFPGDEQASGVATLFGWSGILASCKVNLQWGIQEKQTAAVCSQIECSAQTICDVLQAFTTYKSRTARD